MENNKEELVVMEYKGVVYFITRQEFEDLRDGHLNFEDMFD